MTEPRPVTEDQYTGAPTTESARKWKRDTQPYVASRERAALDNDWTTQFGEAPMPPDPFRLTSTEMEYLGINPETHSYTYVVNPQSRGGKAINANRPRQIMHYYPGSEVVYDPDTQEPMTNGEDLMLMKVPKEYIERREEALRQRTELQTMSNPALAAELGISEEECRRYQDQFDNRLAEIQGFDPRSGDQRKAIIRRADLQSRPMRSSKVSPTFGMTFEDAVESKIKQIGRAYDLDVRTREGRRQAEEFYEKKYLPDIQRRAMADGRASHRASWSDAVESARAMRGGVSMNVGFGKSAMEVLQERKEGKRPAGKQSTKERK